MYLKPELRGNPQSVKIHVSVTFYVIVGSDVTEAEQNDSKFKRLRSFRPMR